jgi:glyoxylase-like metal-dependent hydrolase (beta-lactamase superfamily II)
MSKRALVTAVLIGCGAASPRGPVYKGEPVVIPGSFPADRGPDGNSIVLDAPRGLIVIDTGRHTQHQDKLLAYAKRADRPIAAIVNTHWHLDHTGGNAELRAVYPAAEIVATNAVEGALVGFFPRNSEQTEELVASGKATPQQLEDIRLGREAIADPKNLRPTRPIAQSGPLEIAGRHLDAHVAPFAATEADLWLYDPATRTVVAGDLVVAAVPFFDTGCPTGWRTALGEIAATPFVRLIPGHGDPMTREDFARWHAAFEALLACAASTAEVATCAAGWRTDAAPFIPHGDEARIDEYTTYYVTEILRSPEARERFCKPLVGKPR